MSAPDVEEEPADTVSLGTIALEWGRIGSLGFGGPPAHIALFRSLIVDRKGWLSTEEFEDGIAATNLLPGPASTQLAILCAWNLRGPAGALVGGLCFIVPGLIVILALSVLFFAPHAPLWVRGAAAGAGSAVPAVALQASIGLLPGSWRRTGSERPARIRWLVYLTLGGVSAATVGPWLVLVLAACGILEATLRSPRRRDPTTRRAGALPSAVLRDRTRGPVSRGSVATSVRRSRRSGYRRRRPGSPPVGLAG